MCWLCRGGGVWDYPEVKSSRVWACEGVVFFPFVSSDLCLSQICETLTLLNRLPFVFNLLHCQEEFVPNTLLALWTIK